MKIKRKARTITAKSDRHEKWEIMKNSMAPWVPLGCNIPESTMQELMQASSETGATLEQIVFVAVSQWISKHTP